MIRRVSVRHGKDGYVLLIYDVQRWRAAEEWLTTWVCKMSRGYLCPLCLCTKWQWTFRIGWGRSADGLLRHSLGSLLFHLGQRGEHIGSRDVYERPLSFEEVCEHFPGSRLEYDDDGITYRRGVMIEPQAPVSGEVTP